MRRLIVILILIFYFTGKVQSQTDSVYFGNKPADAKSAKKQRNQDWKEKVTYGGSFQFYFGNVTFIYLSPTVGYIPFKKMNVGLGPLYAYRSDRTLTGRFNQSIMGGQVYANYLVLPNLAFMGRYDKLYQPNWLSLVPNDKVWVDYTLVGIGFFQPAGDRVAFHASLMYNLTPHRLSIYQSDFVFQYGFTARF